MLNPFERAFSRPLENSMIFGLKPASFRVFYLMSAIFVAATAPAVAGPAVSAPAADPAKALTYLDARANAWADKKWNFVTGGTCALSCHTTVPYMMVRSIYGDADGAALGKIKGLVEQRILDWDHVAPHYDFAKASSSSAEGALNGAVLALDDVLSGKTDLAPTTLAGLRITLSSQMQNGGWSWMEEYLAPFEDAGAYYWGSAFISMALAQVPAGAHVAGLDASLHRAGAFLNDNFDQQSLHSQMQAARAGAANPLLLTAARREAVVAQVIGKQRADGGWSLASLGTWRTKSGVLNDPAVLPSDGYATGLAILVLLENGTPATSPSLIAGRLWLESHQADNGAWPLASLNSPQASFNNAIITDTSTAYALLALKALERAE